MVTLIRKTVLRFFRVACVFASLWRWEPSSPPPKKNIRENSMQVVDYWKPCEDARERRNKTNGLRSRGGGNTMGAPDYWYAYASSRFSSAKKLRSTARAVNAWLPAQADSPRIQKSTRGYQRALCPSNSASDRRVKYVNKQLISLI